MHEPYVAIYSDAVAQRSYRDRRHEGIKAALRLQGSSLADVARRLEVAPATVTSVSQGRMQSRRVQDALAEAVKVPAEQLWPERAPQPASLSDQEMPMRSG